MLCQKIEVNQNSSVKPTVHPKSTISNLGAKIDRVPLLPERTRPAMLIRHINNHHFQT